LEKELSEKEYFREAVFDSGSKIHLKRSSEIFKKNQKDRFMVFSDSFFLFL